MTAMGLTLNFPILSEASARVASLTMVSHVQIFLGKHATYAVVQNYSALSANRYVRTAL